MRLDYYGQVPNSKKNTRVATITYRPKEADLADQIIDIMERTTYWKFGGAVENFFIIPMDDYADFIDFKDWYKQIKEKIRGEIHV